MMLPYIHLNLTSNKQEEKYCQGNNELYMYAKTSINIDVNLLFRKF